MSGDREYIRSLGDSHTTWSCDPTSIKYMKVRGHKKGHGQGHEDRSIVKKVSKVKKVKNIKNTKCKGHGACALQVGGRWVGNRLIPSTAITWTFKQSLLGEMLTLH